MEDIKLFYYFCLVYVGEEVFGADLTWIWYVVSMWLCYVTECQFRAYSLLFHLNILKSCCFSIW